MTYASLRYDDAVHVDTRTLKFSGETLEGSSWQTKTNRKRDLVHFSVANTHLEQEGWLEEGWGLFQEKYGSERDHWMPRFYLNSSSMITCDHTTYPEYVKSLDCLRALLWQFVQGRVSAETEEVLSKITWHSCKVTMLDLGAHMNVSERALTVQGHWAPGGAMPLKYARKRSSLGVKMVKDICELQKEDKQPKRACSNDGIKATAECVATPKCAAQRKANAQGRSDDPSKAYVRRWKHWGAPALVSGSSARSRWHLVRADHVRTACGRSIEKLLHVDGIEPPDEMICIKCADLAVLSIDDEPSA